MIVLTVNIVSPTTVYARMFKSLLKHTYLIGMCAHLIISLVNFSESKTIHCKGFIQCITAVLSIKNVLVFINYYQHMRVPFPYILVNMSYLKIHIYHFKINIVSIFTRSLNILSYAY